MTGTKYLILIRNPNGGSVMLINSGDENSPEKAMLYDSEEEAEEAASKIPACRAWPYSIVEAP